VFVLPLMDEQCTGALSGSTFYPGRLTARVFYFLDEWVIVFSSVMAPRQLLLHCSK
jgi:hypothetical protein